MKKIWKLFFAPFVFVLISQNYLLANKTEPIIPLLGITESEFQKQVDEDIAAHKARENEISEAIRKQQEKKEQAEKDLLRISEAPGKTAAILGGAFIGLKVLEAMKNPTVSKSLISLVVSAGGTAGYLIYKISRDIL
ncbi:hypothetical protein HYX58_05440 [Candidatus Dependentiae bacterium]|nr:hypothetical protein [Candidatus Dependentiae bacterium]